MEIEGACVARKRINSNQTIFWRTMWAVILWNGAIASARSDNYITLVKWAILPDLSYHYIQRSVWMQIQKSVKINVIQIKMDDSLTNDFIRTALENEWLNHDSILLSYDFLKKRFLKMFCLFAVPIQKFTSGWKKLRKVIICCSDVNYWRL